MDVFPLVCVFSVVAYLAWPFVAVRVSECTPYSVRQGDAGWFVVQGLRKVYDEPCESEEDAVRLAARLNAWRVR